jgi:hypothetical protein
MITVTAYFLVWCYTTTIASCQTIASLPDAAECDKIMVKVKTKHPGARKDECDSYNVLVISQTGTLPPLPAGVDYLTTAPAKPPQ